MRETDFSAPPFDVLGDLSGSTIIDGLFRQALRLAYPLSIVYRRVLRPKGRGVAVALWAGDRLLVVRHSYRPLLELPGGHAALGEDQRLAAQREILEELGIRLEAEELVLIHRCTIRMPGLSTDEAFFEAKLDAFPKIAIDRREVIWAASVPTSALRKRDCGLFLRQYLRRSGRAGGWTTANEA